MKRILIVDDHAIVRRALRQLVRDLREDVEVEEACDTSEALRLLGERDFDVAVVDLNLPGPDGLHLLEELRGLRPAVRTLVVSAFPEEEFAIRCLQLGAAGYVTKASAPDELGAAISRVLAGGRYVTAALADRLASFAAGELGGALHQALSNRELQVLRLVASGRSLKEIATEMRVAEKTVATYRARIGAKLGASTNVELTRYALKHGLGD